jgi:uncharacterized membrane protein YobD (UPF0266 family)
MLATLTLLGVRSLHRQLAWLATCSFFSGLAQASLLVIISEFAVNSAKGKTHLEVHGYSLSISDALFLSATLLIIYPLASIAVALSSGSISSTALASARNKMIDAFFGASWTL